MLNTLGKFSAFTQDWLGAYGWIHDYRDIMLTIRYVYRSAKYRGAPMHRCIVTSLVGWHSAKVKGHAVLKIE